MLIHDINANNMLGKQYKNSIRIYINSIFNITKMVNNDTIINIAKYVPISSINVKVIITFLLINKHNYSVEFIQEVIKHCDISRIEFEDVHIGIIKHINVHSIPKLATLCILNNKNFDFLSEYDRYVGLKHILNYDNSNQILNKYLHRLSKESYEVFANFYENHVDEIVIDSDNIRLITHILLEYKKFKLEVFPFTSGEYVETLMCNYYKNNIGYAVDVINNNGYPVDIIKFLPGGRGLIFDHIQKYQYVPDYSCGDFYREILEFGRHHIDLIDRLIDSGIINDNILYIDLFGLFETKYKNTNMIYADFITMSVNTFDKCLDIALEFEFVGSLMKCVRHMNMEGDIIEYYQDYDFGKYFNNDIEKYECLLKERFIIYDHHAYSLYPELICVSGVLCDIYDSSSDDIKNDIIQQISDNKFKLDIETKMELLKHKELSAIMTKNIIINNVTCVCCLEDDKELILFIECNHQCICGECLYKLQNDNKCPLCRTHIYNIAKYEQNNYVVINDFVSKNSHTTINNIDEGHESDDGHESDEEYEY
jgi:hypothetical protein